MRGLWESIKLWLVPWLVYLLVYLTNWTLRLKVIGEEKLTKIDQETPILYALWHGFSWIPAYYFRYRNYLALSSHSRDGEYMTRLLKKMGFQIIRGSSTRGGIKSLLQLYRRVKNGASVFLTPDGPTGPIYKAKPGIVYLQEKSAGMIVPLGIAVEHKKIISSWDSYLLPFPGSRAVLKFGDPIRLPVEKSIEERCVILENEINRVKREAEKELLNFKKNGGKSRCKLN